MRPHGLRSSRNWISASLSDVPAQPTMRAPIAVNFATWCSVAVNDAIALTASDQRVADAGGRFLARHRSNAQAIARRARYARFGDLRRQAADDIAIFGAQPVIFGKRLGFAAIGGELGHEATLLLGVRCFRRRHRQG